MSENQADRNVLNDLAADLATQGLSAAERQKLSELSRRHLREAEEAELTAAAVQLAETMPNEPLPAKLRQKILNDAYAFFGNKEAGSGASVQSKPWRLQLPWSAWAGWVVAATLLIAIGIKEYRDVIGRPSADALRQALLLEPGSVRLKWTATADPAAAGLTGEVVWNEREQRGYMTFRKLAGNDSTVAVYQLWIFADNQDERYPADGGVFNVSRASGEVTVPINPKIRVSGAKMFVVTVERPGGVVVSKRERIVSIAKVS